MSTFDATWAAANAACDAHFGEVLRVTPRRAPGADPNARPVADSGRAVFDTVGIYNAAAEARRPEGRGMTSTNTHHFVAARPTIVISTALPSVIRAGDNISRIALSPVESFTVVEVHRHEGGVLVLEVTPE